MISRPFYIGLIDDKDEYDNDIQRSHKYEKIIDRQLFDKCQEIKYGRGYHKYKRINAEYIFTELITCCKCDVAYSSYPKKGDVYLHPSKGRKRVDCDHIGNISEAKLLPQVIKVIKSIAFPESVLQEIKEAPKGCINAQY